MIRFQDTLGHVLILKDPEIGDAEILELKTLIDRAKDGTFRSFITSPPTTKFKLEFKGVNRPKVVEIQQFLLATVATPITYTDYNGNNYQVAILNQPFTSTHAGISNNQFNLELEVLPT